MMDTLLLNDIITLEKRKITVMKEIPYELGHITSLYTYLNEKPRSIDQLMNDYMLSTGSRIKQLTMELGESLLADGVITKGVGGLFGKKTTYIPEKAYKDEVISFMKSVVTKDEEMAPREMALIFILKESQNLNQYFSKYDNDILKVKLKEIKKNPQNKKLAEMINYVSEFTAIMATCFVAGSN